MNLFFNVVSMNRQIERSKKGYTFLLSMVNCYLVEYNYLDYRKALDLQNRVRTIKENDRTYDDFLMILQHNPVFTLGKQGTRDEIIVPDEILIKEGIDVVSVKRGGKVTYHGPGQLVAYFLLDLVKRKISVPDFVWRMEQTIIDTLAYYGIAGDRREGYPGVWVKNRGIMTKVAAVGARASKQITSHGLALNVNTNMDHFQMIIPCGISEFQPISMKQILEKELDMKDIYHQYAKVFAKVFEAELVPLKEEEFEMRLEND